MRPLERNLNAVSQQKQSDYATFTSLIQRLIGLFDPKLAVLYTDNLSLINYAFVCGIGVLINMAIISFFFNSGLGLLIANAIAILCAFLWNWTFSVGPYGYLFDLSKKPVKQVELEE